MGVRVEIRVPQEYPPYCIALLETLFADYAEAAITKHFTAGQSGAFVFLLQPMRQDGGRALPAVVKIGPSHLLEQEWRALFAVLKDQIRCVVLNACYTKEQAKSLAAVIDCVVGIGKDLPDEASIQFAAAFYRALGYGRSVQEAFLLGQSQIALAKLGEEAALQLYGAAAAQTYCVGIQPTDAHVQDPSDSALESDTTPSNIVTDAHNRTDIHNAHRPIHTGSGPIVYISPFSIPFDGVKAWASAFFRVAEANDHERSSWAGMTLYLLGAPMPTVGRWFLALLPPFFAYVSARRIPLDRYKMFDGELRLHAADRLFFAVFALFGPLLAAVVYWGHWFLINQGAMLPLYALGVMLSFTLSQAGMVHLMGKVGRAPPGETVETGATVIHYERGWRWKRTVNAVGAVTTGVVLVVLMATKFVEAVL